MPRKTIPPGTRFGKLIVLREGKRVKFPCGQSHSTSECQCDCGNMIETLDNNLVRGTTRSCGCLQRQLISERSSTHGYSGSRIYILWSRMHNRCRNPGDKSFPYYGGRGIRVCERWKKFENFIADMGEKPHGKTLNRIDNDGNYSPENCQWSTIKEQNRNSRNNRIITVFGGTGCVSELCERFGVNYRLVSDRLKKNWSAERAFTEPVHRR